MSAGRIKKVDPLLGWPAAGIAYVPRMVKFPIRLIAMCISQGGRDLADGVVPVSGYSEQPNSPELA